jgi:hypothetical protein
MIRMNKGKKQRSPKYTINNKNSKINSSCSVEGGGVGDFLDGMWVPRAANGRPLSSRNRSFTWLHRCLKRRKAGELTWLPRPSESEEHSGACGPQVGEQAAVERTATVGRSWGRRITRVCLVIVDGGA